jgi:CO dehydrogenase maturation factor
MAKIIVTTGRGGSGKTTFMALTARLLGSSKTPSLIIDLDGDQSLSDMLGVNLDEKKVRTILDILFDLQKGKAYKELQTMPMPQKIEYLFHTDCVYESDKFDLVTLGVKWTSGCYCLPNDLLRGIIPGMAQSYQYMLVDTPGGLEHLNRKVVSDIDDLFFVLDPSLKAIKNVERTLKLTREIGIKYKKCYLVANHNFNQDLEDRVGRDEGAIYLGKVEYDPEVEKYNLTGKSLLDLPDDSPACLSVNRILAKAGYGTN